ncbi:CHAP domain-containing protein [Chakrabartyella piscis]|uniref:CHAP domain-containing protein n=1 Tax=Chakrabartyella piscis TaxID=2918914 RepID=UPI0029583AA9|nr:CHAP domain-containing protein [Chakrabartyella piscis]
MKKQLALTLAMIIALNTQVLAAERNIIGGYGLYNHLGERIGEVLLINENGTIIHEQKLEEVETMKVETTEEQITQTVSIQSELTYSTLVLTEPPEVGTVLGNIMKEGENLPLNYASSYTEPYATYSLGQCAWYANGRLREVTNKQVHISGAAKGWIAKAEEMDEFLVEYNINQPQEHSVAVYIPINPNDTHPGHVVFIEYIERDDAGNPTYIYYTDANGKCDTELDVFTPNVDGVVRKESFEEFSKDTNLRLSGYVSVNLNE